jgi:isoaspartyl peptidase/L-asparaginase-like protein (Ntn-hydrolase superfamily)
MLAARVIGAIERGMLPEAVMEEAIRRVEALGGEAGGIVLDRDSRIGWTHNGQNFAVGLAADGKEARVHLSKNEEARMRAHA